MKRILSCDTAHGFCSVSLIENGEIISFAKEEEKSRQAELFFDLIDKVIGDLNYRMLDALAVNIGPGSFTGIRVGVAALKGIMLVSKIPVIPVTSLEALAFNAYTKDIDNNSRVDVVINANRGQLYHQSFKNNISISEAKLINIEDFACFDNSYVIGDGVELLNSNINIIDNNLPDASDIALCAYNKFEEKEEYIDIKPLYIRPPDAKKSKYL